MASDPLEQSKLAAELSRWLDEVVFTVEHGIPTTVVDALADVVAKLEALRLPIPALRDLRTAIEAIRNVEPDAVNRLLQSGQQVVAELSTGQARGG